MTLPDILRWAHMIGMLAMVGGVLIVQIGMPAVLLEDPAARRRISIALNMLMTLGVITGAALYIVYKGWTEGRTYNVIMISKFVLLLGIGASLGIGLKRPAARSLRWAAVILLLAAALLATMLRG